MRYVIAGGSGQVGAVLTRALVADGHDVVVLTRDPRVCAGVGAGPARVVGWDARTLGAWAAEIDGADVVVNLAGRSVNCRYTPINRRLIMDSRVDSTRVIGEAIAAAAHPPRVWLQASTATIYAHRLDAPNDERGILGGGEPGAPDTWRFSIDVARAWERTLDHANTPHTRKVAMRSAMIMSPDRGGIFDTLRALARYGLGGPAAGGRQYISWIHHHDFTRAVAWLVEHDEIDGAINLASPNPLPNAAFMRELRRACGVRMALPATKLMLEAGAVLMRTESELVLKSRRVVPGRLLEHGFAFVQPDWPAAARELCSATRTPIDLDEVRDALEQRRDEARGRIAKLAERPRPHLAADAPARRMRASPRPVSPSRAGSARARRRSCARPAASAMRAAGARSASRRRRRRR